MIVGTEMKVAWAVVETDSDAIASLCLGNARMMSNSDTLELISGIVVQGRILGQHRYRW